MHIVHVPSLVPRPSILSSWEREEGLQGTRLADTPSAYCLVIPISLQLAGLHVLGLAIKSGQVQGGCVCMCVCVWGGGG